MSLSRSSLPENPLEDWICSAGSGLFKSSFLSSWRVTGGSRTPIISTRLQAYLETVDQVEPDPVMRLAALLHDIAKPGTEKGSKGSFISRVMNQQAL